MSIASLSAERRRDAGRQWLHAALRLLATWRERSRQRRELSLLTSRELRDAGITPFDAIIEAEKPFWRE